VTTNADIHVLPLQDLREHVEERGCWCHPTLIQENAEADVVVVHQSMDGRELVEEHGIQ
jgi:hypothetical protein